MPNHLNFSDDEKQELVAMLDRGVTVAEIRRRFGGITTKRVELIAEEVRNPPKTSQSRADRNLEVNKKLVEIRAFAKYQQGYSAAKLASLAGTSPAYVKKWLDHQRATAQ